MHFMHMACMGRSSAAEDSDLVNTKGGRKFRRGDLKMPDWMGKGGGRERKAA